MTQVVVEEITIIGSRCGPFKPAIEALSREDIIFPEITLYNLKDYESAFNNNNFKSGFLINEF